MSSFEARRLRVQIPCGSVTLIQCGGFTFCRFLSCGYPTIWGCGVIHTRWCEWGTCGWASPDPCGFISPVVQLTPEVLCAGSEEIQPKVTIDPEELPVLRERLEAQLKEIQSAEEQVKKQAG
jgi:hypothetical protein